LIVQNDVDFLIGWTARDDFGQEGSELDAGVPGGSLPLDLARSSPL
jgi:hypothetical protein